MYNLHMGHTRMSQDFFVKRLHNKWDITPIYPIFKYINRLYPIYLPFTKILGHPRNDFFVWPCQVTTWKLFRAHDVDNQLILTAMKVQKGDVIQKFHLSFLKMTEFHLKGDHFTKEMSSSNHQFSRSNCWLSGRYPHRRIRDLTWIFNPCNALTALTVLM